MFTFGIEHEVAFLRSSGEFASFHSTTYAEFAAVVARLPRYEEDYPQLRVGHNGIREKRWYVEGFERFDTSGQPGDLLPKGIEIRTRPQATIRGSVEELVASFHLLQDAARCSGLSPALISFHPYRTEVEPVEPFNTFERAQIRRSPSLRSALFSLLSYGPDLNLSYVGASSETLIDLGRKYTFYSPYIIPFSYSSPFYKGALWDGLSVRTFLRITQRPVVNVFLEQRMANTDHRSLYKVARTLHEVGRIEFKACDSCDDFTLYAALLALLKGLCLDRTLAGRADFPDVALHQRSARAGFTDPAIFAGAQEVLSAARDALADDEDQVWLTTLQDRLERRCSMADTMRELFSQQKEIEPVLQQSYSLYR